MSNKYWFKPKSYGYGFVPATQEGWLATLGLLVLLMLAAHTDGLFVENVAKHSVSRFLLDAFILGSLFTVMFKDRVEHGLAWRWGFKK